MQYVIGIDGGGSKCDAVRVDLTGQILGWGRGGQIQPYYDTSEAIHRSYLDALDGALGEVQGAQFVVASPSRRRQKWEQRIVQAGDILEIFAASEQKTALAAAGQEWGIVALAGTGSFVHGRSPDGERRLHFGAMGPVLGDFGSGYEIGLAGLRAAFASHWTAARETSLAQVIPAALRQDDLHRVFHVIYMQGLERREIASLARVVNEQAEAGDRIAADILRQAADSLFALVRDMVHELGLADQEFPFVAAGSVATKSRLWWERMCERVAEIAPRARPIQPRLMMVVGAALLGLRKLGVAWTPQVLDNLERTQAEALKRLEAPATWLEADASATTPLQV